MNSLLNPNRLTVGQLISKNNQVEHSFDDSIQEYSRAMSPNLMKQLQEDVELAKKHPKYENKDFYITAYQFKDRMLGQYTWKAFVRLSCPTPYCNQTTFKYHKDSGELEFLWTIPNINRYFHILQHRDAYLQDPRWMRIAQWVILMESGALLEWVKKQNGGKPDAVIRLSDPE